MAHCFRITGDIPPGNSPWTCRAGSSGSTSPLASRLSGAGLLVAEADGVPVGATVGAWEGQMLEQPSVRPP